MVDNTSAHAETHPGRPGSAKFGLGVFLAFLSVFLGLASLVFIWLGIIPGLMAFFGALPLGIAAHRLIRRGQPATTLTVDDRK